MNASGNVGSTTWAHYSFENTLSDTSGNGQHLVSGSSWSPTYVAGVSGQAVYLNQASETYAGSSHSWLKGPTISKADVSGQFFEISFYLAMVSQGYYHGEWLLTFTSIGDSTNTVPLLMKGHGGGDLTFGPSNTVVLSAANVWTSAWHAVKLSTADPCSSSTWTLDFDGTTYSAASVPSICGRELHLNRHCWAGGQSCSSRINMMIDEMVITSGVANPPTPSPTATPTPSPTPSPTSSPTASPTASPTPSPTASPAPSVAATGDPHLQNIFGERFDLMKPGVHVLINIPRGVSVENALLRVQASARRLGGQCADMYFQELNVTGSWAEAKQVGGYHYSVSQNAVEIPQWIVFGHVELKVVHGHTDEGLLYLNIYAKHLGRAGFPVGGLLGEDDHEDVTTPLEECARRIELDSAHVDPNDLSRSTSWIARASLA